MRGGRAAPSHSRQQIWRPALLRPALRASTCPPAPDAPSPPFPRPTCSRSQIDSAKQHSQPAAAGAKELAWDPATAAEPLDKQAQHAKVLAKGRPDDALPGIKGRQVPLEAGQAAIPGLLNAVGAKVRLTFKPELQQLWIGSAQSTQKVPYSSVAKIEAAPIEGGEEYSIVSLQLGASASSRYWLYYVPSQYVAAIKMRVLGVAALL